MKVKSAVLVKQALLLLVATAAFGAASAKAQFEQLDPFNKNSAVNKAGIRLNDIPPFKHHDPVLSRPSVQPGATFQSGPVLLNNDYGPGGDVAVRLYHPQGGGRIFATYAFRGQENGVLTLNDQNVIVGSDWGMQVVFGNGVQSPIRVIGNVANYDGGQFIVRATRILGQ